MLIHHATNHNSTSDNAIFYGYFYTTACILTSVRIQYISLLYCHFLSALAVVS